MTRPLLAAALATTLASAAPPAAAQDATPHLSGPATSALVATTHPTAFESYVEQPGRLLVERARFLDRIRLAGGAALRLEPVIVFEPAVPQERMLGVRLHVEGTTLSGRRATVYLDLHEVESLLRGIQAMPTLFGSEDVPAGGRLEIRQETRDGLVLAATSRGNGVRRFLRLRRSEITEIEASEQSFQLLAEQLDACRRFLFQQ